MSNLTLLYNNWRSSCSWRVRIVLNLKSIPHDMKEINIFRPADPNVAHLREVNPMAKVPVLIIDNQILIESMSILEYLEETGNERPLLPNDFIQRARVREICQIIISGMQPLQNYLTLRKYVTRGKFSKWVKSRITKGFNGLEKLLSTCAGTYCVGNDITLADCCLVPQTYVATRYDVDLSEYPLISRIYKELEREPAFITAHPVNLSVSYIFDALIRW